MKLVLVHPHFCHHVGHTLLDQHLQILIFFPACYKQCWVFIQALRAKKNEVNSEFNAKYQEYIKLDKNYNNYMRSVKRKE